MDPCYLALSHSGGSTPAVEKAIYHHRLIRAACYFHTKGLADKVQGCVGGLISVLPDVSWRRLKSKSFGVPGAEEVRQVYAGVRRSDFGVAVSLSAASRPLDA